jgi:hypothetical protein
VRAERRLQKASKTERFFILKMLVYFFFNGGDAFEWFLVLIDCLKLVSMLSYCCWSLLDTFLWTRLVY